MPLANAHLCVYNGLTLLQRFAKVCFGMNELEEYI